jgi:GTPase Era involved in 16S rRNA processing
VSYRLTSRRRLPAWAIAMIIFGAVSVIAIPLIVVVVERSARAAARDQVVWEQMQHRHEQLVAWRKRVDELHNEARIKSEAFQKSKESGNDIESIVKARSEFAMTPAQEAELADLLRKIKEAEAQEKAQRASP